jgi:5'-deoxynucleotidase YfbR-like HD superfamily hydrolase
VAERIGNWMLTVGGRAFYPLDPRPEDIEIEDIAHALSMICRFGGHSSKFYSVAEHSLRVAMAISGAGGTRDESFAGLMHDAAEAYVGDMIWPLKRSNQARGYKEVESLVELAIAMRFGFPAAMPPIVKRFDLVLLSTEKRDLMNAGWCRKVGAGLEAEAAATTLGPWHSDAFEPLPEVIDPMTQPMAKAYFLTLFNDLSAGRLDR